METEGTPKINARELFYCPQHGMIEPGRFKEDWTTDEGCPVFMADEESCESPLTAVDLSPLLLSLAESQEQRGHQND